MFMSRFNNNYVDQTKDLNMKKTLGRSNNYYVVLTKIKYFKQKKVKKYEDSV